MTLSCFLVFHCSICWVLLWWFLAIPALIIHNNTHIIVFIVRLIFQTSPSKEIDSAKESSRPDRPYVFTKRSTHTATVQHKRPASSVNAEIIGGSTLTSQAMLKQEVSTASSKGSTLKTGMLLCPKKSATTFKFVSYSLNL